MFRDNAVANINVVVVDDVATVCIIIAVVSVDDVANFNAAVVTGAVVTVAVVTVAVAVNVFAAVVVVVFLNLCRDFLEDFLLFLFRFKL